VLRPRRLRRKTHPALLALKTLRHNVAADRLRRFTASLPRFLADDPLDDDGSVNWNVVLEVVPRVRTGTNVIKLFTAVICNT
jgi:hypothetical protein